jgi:hypothetical protein
LHGSARLIRFLILMVVIIGHFWHLFLFIILFFLLKLFVELLLITWRLYFLGIGKVVKFFFWRWR